MKRKSSAQVLSLLALLAFLVQKYKSTKARILQEALTKTGARAAQFAGEILEFTCFTSTKVQILQEALTKKMRAQLSLPVRSLRRKRSSGTTDSH
jgi:hypothetical protein